MNFQSQNIIKVNKMYLHRKDVVFIFIPCLYFWTNEAKKLGKTFSFVSTTVTFNPEYMQDHRVTVTSNTTLDVILNTAREYPADPWLLLEMSTQNRKTKSYRTLLTYDVNMCNILGKQGNNLITTWLSNFWKYGNLPKSCPVLKGNYSWKDLRIEKLSLPDFLPTGLQKVRVDTYFRLKPQPVIVANVTIFVQIK